MSVRIVPLIFAAFAIHFPPAAAAPAPGAPTVVGPRVCGAGAYRFSDGSWIVLYGGDSSDSLAYASSDREVGQLKLSGGEFVQHAPRRPFQVSFAGCKPEQLAVRHNGRKLSAKRLLLPATHVRFQSDEVELSGTLVLPASGQADTIVVWVTGSDQTPDVDHVYWQYVLPINSVGVFVFDKRGTGQSGGSHTANFHLRASDVGGLSDIALNAPRRRISVGLQHRDRQRGLTTYVRARHALGFPMNSGVYIGDVPAYATADAGLAYRLPSHERMIVTVSAQNVLGKAHREFVGAPMLGRLVVAQLQYSLP